MRRLIVAALVLLPSLRAFADVRIAPTFAGFAIAGHFILLVSPDHKRLICVDDTGAVRWKKSVPDLGGFGELDDHTFYLQDGGRVFRVNAATGSPALAGSIPRRQLIAIDARAGLAWSSPNDFLTRQFVARDPVTLRRLWNDPRIESVADADERRLFVVTVTRHPEKDGYTMSGATLLALDRADGHDLWSHPLTDGQTPEVRAAVVGPYLAFIDGITSSTIVLLDRATGRVVTSRASSDFGSEGLFDISSNGSAELLVLQALAHDAPDRLTTLSVPELRSLTSIPLVAKENLSFFVDGETIVTSGIYSIAAFDRATGNRLWQIDKQRLIQRPAGGRLFATLNENDTAILEQIEVGTGIEKRLYEEPLPPALTAAALARQEEEWQRKEKQAKEERHSTEAKQRLPIGKNICLRYDRSGMLDVREYWLLSRDGTAKYVDIDPQTQSFRAFGRWRKSGDTYEIDGTPLVRDIVADGVSVGVGIKPNVALLADLRDVIEAFLFARPAQQTFSREDLDQLQVRRPGCPPEAKSWCSGDQLFVDVAKEPTIPEEPAHRDSLDHIAHAIDDYIRDAAHADRLRFRLREYRSYTYAEWLDPHSYWSTGKAGDAEREIDSALDFQQFATHDAARNAAREPALFRLCACGELERELARETNVLTIGKQ